MSLDTFILTRSHNTPSAPGCLGQRACWAEGPGTEQQQCPARAALACVRPSLSRQAPCGHSRTPAQQAVHLAGNRATFQTCVWSRMMFQEVAPLPKDYLCWGSKMEGTLWLLYISDWMALSLSIDMSFPSEHKARVRIQEKISGPGVKRPGQEGHLTPQPLPAPGSLRR